MVAWACLQDRHVKVAICDLPRLEMLVGLMGLLMQGLLGECHGAEVHCTGLAQVRLASRA